MIYAAISDITVRLGGRDVSEEKCTALLEDAAVIIDAYNAKASDDAKKLVSCNMVIRAIGNGEEAQVPIGTTQGTVSGLGYSQTWTMGNGSTGELYLSRLDKHLLGSGSRIGFANALEVDACSMERQ